MPVAAFARQERHAETHAFLNRITAMWGRGVRVMARIWPTLLALVLLVPSTGCSGDSPPRVERAVPAPSSAVYEGEEPDRSRHTPGYSPYRSRSHGEDISGTFTAEVCGSSGCYDLDVDVVDGEVVTIYFPNGGHNDISGSEIDESGYASGDAYTWSQGYSGETWDIYGLGRRIGRSARRTGRVVGVH